MALHGYRLKLCSVKHIASIGCGKNSEVVWAYRKHGISQCVPILAPLVLGRPHHFWMSLLDVTFWCNFRYPFWTSLLDIPFRCTFGHHFWAAMLVSYVTIRARDLKIWEDVHLPPPITCQVSGVRCPFVFLQSGGASRWRVCYKRGLSRLVFSSFIYSKLLNACL